MKNEIKEIIKKRGNELDFYVLIYNTKTTEYLNDIIFQNYEEALKKFYATNANDVDVVVEIMFSPQKDDEEYYDNVLIMRKGMFYTKEDLVGYGCSDWFIERVWELPTDKIYEVTCNEQGGNFGTNRQYTVRDWACQAIEWLFMDEWDTNAEWLLKNTIKVIEDYWSLVIGDLSIEEVGGLD